MKKIIAILLLIILVAANFYNGAVACFFYNNTVMFEKINLGSVAVEIENLEVVEKNNVVLTDEHNTISTMLNINSSCVFSFSVANNGGSAIDYNLSLLLAWDDEIEESGKLFVFPENMTDDEIRENINSGGQKAIISQNDSDQTIIDGLADTKRGIKKTIDMASLERKSSNDMHYKNYKFKFYIHINENLSDDLEFFHNKQIELAMLVDAGLMGKTTNWVSTAKKIFKITSQAGSLFPTIQEMVGAKNFFVSQTSLIKLENYAVAIDPIEGDISSKLVITYPPEIFAGKAGKYKIIYNVENSLGKPAIPLEIHIVVWDFVKIASGNYHTLALTSHGMVYAWGYNSAGQIGDGTTTYRNSPKLVNGLNDIIDVAAGNECSYALSASGKAYAWGSNTNYKLGDNTTTTRNKPTPVRQPTDVLFVKIAARYGTAGGLTANGDVYVWGYGGYGAAGTGATRDVPAPSKINVSNIVDFDIGNYNGIAASKSGQVYTWGDNLNGQLGNGASMAVGNAPPAIVPFFTNQSIKIKSVSAGFYHMTAVADDGRLFTWGEGTDGKLGNGSTARRNTPQLIQIASPVKIACAARYHSAAVTENGEVYFFGQNAYGKHGSGNTTAHQTPYLLSTLSKVTGVSLAIDSSFVIVNGRICYGMGYGGTGVLGTGNNSNSNVPVAWTFTPPQPS